MIAFFSAPHALEGAGLAVWFAIFAIACEAFDSLLHANYGALLPKLFPAVGAVSARFLRVPEPPHERADPIG